ncbi:MAG: twitching motility protein PilT [Lachnospiraceae bacterium]|nr:twitching motility protein PilT [Lachnospiraceae bacterium]MDE6055086.1 twitching motility protein PilT [Lachnospiraceae bacterium]MDE7205462.1 twitching motility protein PilT [Lachnospiraceae bacterium]MDE7416619.1 twitching motility protein PilT [Lachnospiraceae bacterium]
MVQLIVGKKGKGKTKIILDMVNKEVSTASGNIVYLDKGNDHMYELNNKVRLINVKDYGVANADEFVGFIRGIISQDHDLEQIYFDGFLKISCIEGTDQVEEVINKLDSISNTYGFKMIASISLDEAELPESLKSKVVVAL